MAPRADKLFSVKMGEGAYCGCGAAAAEQFVITSSQVEANRIGKEAKLLRASGQKCADAACGLCMARKISSQGLGVMALNRFQVSPIKYQQVTAHDVHCESCSRALPFGTWAYYQIDTGLGVCVDCGVAKGWSNKAIAGLQVQEKWHRVTVAALRKRIQIEAAGLHLIEQKVDLCQIAPRYDALEGRIQASLYKLDSYLNSVATPAEKAILEQLKLEILESRGLAEEIKKDMECRLYLLEKAEKTQKFERLINDAPDSEAKGILEHSSQPALEAPHQ